MTHSALVVIGYAPSRTLDAVNNVVLISTMAFRQTISFTEPQADYLRREAEKLGITFSEAARRVIDRFREIELARDFYINPQGYIPNQEGTHSWLSGKGVPPEENPLVGWDALNQTQRRARLRFLGVDDSLWSDPIP